MDQILAVEDHKEGPLAPPVSDAEMPKIKHKFAMFIVDVDGSVELAVYVKQVVEEFCVLTINTSEAIAVKFEVTAS